MLLLGHNVDASLSVSEALGVTCNVRDGTTGLGVAPACALVIVLGCVQLV